MRLAFVIFDRMTALDFIGLYDPLTRLKSMGFVPDLTWDVVAVKGGVRDDKGLFFTPTVAGEPLDGYDALLVPGGFGTRTLMYDHEFLGWLRSAGPIPLKASVCTGALLLGAAGFLTDFRATTHPAAVLSLQPFCRLVEDQRIIDEGPVITARGVTAAIDLGLYLVEKFAGIVARERIAKQMDYPSDTYALHLASSG